MAVQSTIVPVFWSMAMGQSPIPERMTWFFFIKVRVETHYHMVPSQSPPVHTRKLPKDAVNQGDSLTDSQLEDCDCYVLRGIRHRSRRSCGRHAGRSISDPPYVGAGSGSPDPVASCTARQTGRKWGRRTWAVCSGVWCRPAFSRHQVVD